MRKRRRYKSMRLGEKKEIANKLLFTFIMIAVFKLLAFVPSPFVNMSEVQELVSKLSLLETAELFSGQAISHLTLMATGVSSYITASIVLQFLTYGSKRLNELSKSSNGEKVMQRITLAMGLVISFVSSIVLTYGLSKQNAGVLTNNEWYAFVTVAAFHSFGTFLAISIGNLIEKKGYGNGLSLLIAVNVVSSIPSIINSLKVYWLVDKVATLIIIGLTTVMILTIIIMESSEKKIPVRYSKVVARSTGHMRSQKQTLPMKINSAGVMPIILASTILQLVVFALGFSNNSTVKEFLSVAMNPQRVYYGLITSSLILIFTFVYSAIIFDANDVADSLQKNGGTILGIRPGRSTRDFLKRINKSLTRLSAAYLLFVSLIPTAITILFGFSGIQATSLMIVVGVSLDSIMKFTNEYNLGKMKL